MELKTLALISTATACLLSTTPSIAGQRQNIDVQGHRGSRASHPENTLPAFAHALESGVDTLELDLQLTKDNHLVVAHDRHVSSKLCRTSDGQAISKPIPIHSLTLKQLKTYDCGNVHQEAFPNQVLVPHTAIPSLAEVFSFVSESTIPGAKSVKFNIEMKIVPRFVGASSHPEQFAQLLLDTAKQYGMLDRITVESFDHRSLLAIKHLNSSVPVAALLGDDLPDWQAVIIAAKADIISPDMDWVTAEAVQAAHAIGARVIPYSANHEEDWNYLMACGVDGIITDDPAALVNFLRAKGLR
ncbi:MAG: glycerophosphodiester phosphodiesterase family protein [Proteobacteria bacterium]|nr:glycerophosphodiester phosphodiesterase family protein [Pseudomonadota bacterium]